MKLNSRQGDVHNPSRNFLLLRFITFLEAVQVHKYKYDGCCIYIGTPQKKDYFLSAETPGAERAWVSTLQATQLVLKAHKEAVNSLSGNGSKKLGMVATVVAVANSTALESSKEIEAAMKITMRTALGAVMNKAPDSPMDDLTIMKVLDCSGFVCVE
ncbi:hypothetical protein POM88_001669 [Heracleum sosnowskyi]|uniref:PH domain-containing protein n=1 Tax=Heracleum sosnowskyi TaxID=360622 RepID=A0AAD8N9U2_9APIA|nr:hypothetical protein POM88_001669 [Heracleum sosnowskyi]